MLCYGFLFAITYYLFHYVRTNERTKIPRYAIEPNVKPAIFGSYSYDMVKKEFVIPDKRNSSTTEINLTDIILNSTTSVIDENYRKHVGITTETIQSFDWLSRARLFLKNATSKFQYRGQSNDKNISNFKTYKPS